MKYLPLVWRNLMRRKVRTAFTLAAVVIGFVLFGLLMAMFPKGRYAHSG